MLSVTGAIGERDIKLNLTSQSIMMIDEMSPAVVFTAKCDIRKSSTLVEEEYMILLYPVLGWDNPRIL